MAENLNSDEYPEVVGFKGRTQQHRCFDKSMSHTLRGGPSAGGAYLQAVASKISEDLGPAGARSSGAAVDMARMVKDATETRINKVNIRFPTFSNHCHSFAENLIQVSVKKRGFRIAGNLKNL